MLIYQGLDPASGETKTFPIPLPAKFVSNASAGASTMAQGDITGAGVCGAQYTGIGAAALTTRTAAQIIADAALSGFGVGDSWLVIITNTNAGTLTVTAGAGVTVNGTATVAQNTGRIFVCTITGAAAVTLQSQGTTAGL